MQYIDHYLTIDMLRERVPDTIWVRAAGIGHRLHVKLTAGPETVLLPGETEGLVQFVYQKPGGEKSDVAMTVNEFRASVVIPRAAVDTVGIVTCEIRVYDSTAGTWWTSPEFTLTVQSVVYDEDAQQQIESDPTVYESILGSEATRVANEEAREDAEETRAENETRRQQAMDDMQDELDDMSDELDSMQAALDTKADKNHTVITGSLSMNRAAGSTRGSNSVALGSGCTASGNKSFAAGEGSTASNACSAAIGIHTISEGNGSFAEGSYTQALGPFSHAEGASCVAEQAGSHAEGQHCKAQKAGSHAEGVYCTAASKHQHVQGRYNIPDADDRYAHIQGNGTYDNSRSNAHTVDWDGNAWFAGDARVGGTDYDDADKLVTESEMDAAITEAIEGRGSGSVYFGKCETAASTAIKDVTVGDDFVKTEGCLLYVWFKYANSATNAPPQLKIGTDAAVSICLDATGSSIVSESMKMWVNNSIVQFTYRNSRWVILPCMRASTNEYGVVKLSNSTSSTSETTAATSKAVKAAYDKAEAADTKATAAAAATAEKTGTFTPNFTPGSGNNLTVKQIGHVVYLSGVLKRSIPFGSDDLGTISGVDAPLQTTEIPIVSWDDGSETYDDIHPGWITVSVDQGVIKLAQTIYPVDNDVKINGFYFTA